MNRRPPISTRTDTLFPYPTLCRSLEGERVRDVISGGTQRMMLPTHGEHGGARRIALVEDVDLRARIAPELQCNQRQEHRLASPGRTYDRSEEHTSELQSLMRISYADFCLKKKTHTQTDNQKE